MEYTKEGYKTKKANGATFFVSRDLLQKSISWENTNRQRSDEYLERLEKHLEQINSR